LALLNIDEAIIQQLIEEKYGRKKGPARIEIRRRSGWAPISFASNFTCPSSLSSATMDGNTGKILIDGNTAAALGCVYAGATVAAWYPITPSTSTMDAFKVFCERFRKDKETGENNFLILQARRRCDRHGDSGLWNGAPRIHFDRRPGHLG